VEHVSLRRGEEGSPRRPAGTPGTGSGHSPGRCRSGSRAPGAAGRCAACGPGRRPACGPCRGPAAARRWSCAARPAGPRRPSARGVSLL
jgi:hypothetical protein